jgi:hypothetical protein
MIRHNGTSDIELKKRIKQNEICFGENVKPRIYGKLNCISGKGMRVFFCYDRKPYRRHRMNNG